VAAGGRQAEPLQYPLEKPYCCVSLLTLSASVDEKGYESGFRGCFSNGPKPARKSERAKRPRIVLDKKIEAPAEEPERRLFARATPVFAAEQVDGYDSPAVPEISANDISSIDKHKIVLLVA
jgi:hypothetical protein